MMRLAGIFSPIIKITDSIFGANPRAKRLAARQLSLSCRLEKRLPGTLMPVPAAATAVPNAPSLAP